MKRDRGSASTEMAFAVVSILAVIALIVGAPRIVTSRGSVSGAASAAARAAAGARSAGEAQSLANTAASLALKDSQCSFVSVKLNGWAPGGAVTATVTCQLPMGDLSRAEFGSGPLQASATEHVDAIRGKK